MILASHQPDFFPWMGYFYKIFQSDAFVFSDNVQYSKTGRHNYNLIKTRNGPLRITLPIHYHAINISDLKLAADEKTVKTTLKTIEMEYGKAAHFDEAFPIIKRLYESAPKAESLATFNMDCIMTFCELFGIAEGRKFYISSELPLTLRRDERIIEMCKLLNADTYFSGVAAKDYHIEENYKANGIGLVYSDYEPIVYPQLGGQFEQNMCCIDYVLNCGFELPRGWKKNG